MTPHECKASLATTLPAESRDQGQTRRSTGRPDQKAQILIAEDDDLISDALARMLGANGAYDCMTARSFAELSRLLDGPLAFQSIILDLHMPGMLGFSSVRAIKQKAPGCHILVFTGDDRASVIELFVAGVSGVVFKTSGLPVIKTALSKVLSGRRFIPDKGGSRQSKGVNATPNRAQIDCRKVRRKLLLQGRLTD